MALRRAQPRAAKPRPVDVDRVAGVDVGESADVIVIAGDDDGALDAAGAEQKTLTPRRRRLPSRATTIRAGSPSDAVGSAPQTPISIATLRTSSSSWSTSAASPHMPGAQRR